MTGVIGGVLGSALPAVSGGLTVSGGTLVSDATYYYRVFTANDTLSVSGGSLTADVLMVGGGGGQSYNGTGAGAGGVFATTASSLGAGNYTVVIGAGGSGSAVAGSNGSSGTNTTFTGLTNALGGAGGISSGNAGTVGISGGSGGGAAGISTGGVSSWAGGSATQTATGGTAYANAGGAVTAKVSAWGGGGGSGSAGGSLSVAGSGSGGDGTSAFSSWLSAIAGTLGWSGSLPGNASGTSGTNTITTDQCWPSDATYPQYIVIGSTVSGTGIASGATITDITANTVLTTTTTAATNVGDTTVALTSVTGVQVGQFLRFGLATAYRNITAINGNTVTISAPIVSSAPSGSQVNIQTFTYTLSANNTGTVSGTVTCKNDKYIATGAAGSNNVQGSGSTGLGGYAHIKIVAFAPNPPANSGSAGQHRSTGASIAGAPSSAGASGLVVVRYTRSQVGG